MQLHSIKPTTKNRPKKRIGRGGKRGTYSGKGLKGQKSRAGRKMRPQMRDIIKKIPKKRGYRFSSIHARASVVNIGTLNSIFAEGDVVSPEALAGKKLIKKLKASYPPVKILGKGVLDKKIIVSGCVISKSAKEAVEKAGGKITAD